MTSPATNDVLRFAWRQTVVIDEPLGPAHQAGAVEGLSTGFYASLQGRRVYVKPRLANNPGVAAREKVCADLAAELVTPVPPVVLVKRHCADGEEAFCCASLVMFPKQMPWSAVDPTTTPYRYDLVERMLSDLPIAGARAIVFDTWVDQIDHNSKVANHNIIVGTESFDADGHLLLLDYQLALGAGGSWRNGSRDVAMASLPTSLLNRAERHEVEESLQRLEALDDCVIADVVSRIPGEFLSQVVKNEMIEGLLTRKPLVRSALRPLGGS